MLTLILFIRLRIAYKNVLSSVTVDIEELADAAGDIEHTEELLQAKAATLPAWIVAVEDKIDLTVAESGTIVVLEDLIVFATLRVGR